MTESAARTTPGYCAWWSEKPDDRDIILIQVRANASMTTLPSHVEVRPAYSGGHLGWGAFIERDVPCHHCGALPDEDGDHSCPCPNPDGGCPEQRVGARRGLPVHSRGAVQMTDSAAPCEHKRTFHDEGEGVVMCQDCDEVLMITSRSDAPLLDATREVAE